MHEPEPRLGAEVEQALLAERQVIQDGDPEPAFQKVTTKDRAQIARATGDQDGLRHEFVSLIG